ncbi:MAG TPA: NAD(P)/FAD-dependent oxidoreductase [Gammaproteobacteria bacterium]|nr:NAD(P)/FAD-dependent oxidoreductase [Gammaproteobacteria bacterium]
MSPSGKTITLMGAGLAGSLLAVMLARRGFTVTIFEKRGDLRTEQLSAGRSINLALAARGIEALKHADLWNAVQPLLIPMPGRGLHSADGEESFQPYSKNPDEVNYSVSRHDLNALLLDAAENLGVEIFFGQACQSVDFSDNTLSMFDQTNHKDYLVRAAPLIATDGAGSPVRQAMAAQGFIKNDEALLGHAYKELCIPPGPNGEWQIKREALHIWPRGGFMVIALPNTDGSFTVTLFLAQHGVPSFDSLVTKEKLRAFFEKAFADLLPLLPTLEDDFFNNPTGMLGTVRCAPWHVKGKALLLGDAAHAIVPFHGQGMNAAFEDCIALDKLLADNNDWHDVFRQFSEQRKPNADAIADMALENYIEMRDTVRDPAFHLQKALGWELEKQLPDTFIPRYEMVMFHPEISYAQAQQRGARQKALLMELTAQHSTLDTIDIAAAVEQARQVLDEKP